MKLRINEVLDYYDGPQIMDCIGEDGTRHVALMLADGAESEYVTVRIGWDRMRDYKQGKIDLRRLMTEPKNWSLANMVGDGLEISFQGAGAVREDYLPDEGYFNVKR